MQLTKKIVDELTYKIIGAAITVHKELGPGLLEKVYHECMIYELRLLGLEVSSEHPVDVTFKGVKMKTKLRADLLIENTVVVELKSLNAMPPILDAQVITYMKQLRKPKGVLINFNVLNIFKEGQRTLVNELYRSLPDK